MTDLTNSSRDKSSIRVLLIDDSKSARRSSASQLSSAGYTVITSTDGFTALADLVEHRPHIVVADIVMPRLDGYQICALIKHSAEHQSTPVVLMSSRDGLFDRARGRLVGADAHLAKPVSGDEFIHTLEQCLQQQRTVECAAQRANNAAGGVSDRSVGDAPDAAGVATTKSAAEESGDTVNPDETLAIAPV